MKFISYRSELLLFYVVTLYYLCSRFEEHSILVTCTQLANSLKGSGLAETKLNLVTKSVTKQPTLPAKSGSGFFYPLTRGIFYPLNTILYNTILIGSFLPVRFHKNPSPAFSKLAASAGGEMQLFSKTFSQTTRSPS